MSTGCPLGCSTAKPYRESALDVELVGEEPVLGVFQLNIATVTFLSPALGRHVTYTVLLPEPTAGPGPYPVLYQLHGASDDHTAWVRLSNLTRYVAGLPLLVVLPDGGLSFWLNFSAHERYEDFLIQDLPEHLQRTFPVRPGKAAIGGLSMGGFGALRLAFKYPDRFASAWAHSSALWSPEVITERFGGVMTDPKEADIYRLVEQVDPNQLPAIAFDCGTEDFLIEQNRQFHAFLEARGIPHIYKEHPGGHTWDYWDVHVREALAFHVQNLGLSTGAGCLDSGRRTEA
ncbi:MAG: esterase family protein [Limnochordales bacterium]|nr:esterase family protein [Limnochordales bacterium]